ncbi:MAG: ABC transporter substrate-binding protein [Myxococcales bacterium FL481]|nr:MAG: ABC transporter substrate-binding protein [Myxococcales bacterium FL481]
MSTRRVTSTMHKLLSSIEALVAATLVAGTLPSTTLAASAESQAAAMQMTPRRSEVKREALETFRERHEAVMALVKKGAKADVLQREVDDLLDYEWLAQAALGGKKRYEKNCTPRCPEFQALLTRLIRENYLRLIRKADNHPVRYVDQVRGARGAYKVTTEITVTKNGRQQVLEVAYVMHQIGDKWQVRNIITDGMSLAKNYRYELNQVRKREGIDGIISRLETKLAEIAKNK